ncbi:Disease resistance protein [Nymphaea thermarum]|nr:Disease resistance protein [Nymphaea thermarum]
MTSAIISSVAKELGARISYEVGLIWNAKEDLQNLKSEFEAIQAVAEVADGLPYLKNEEVKDWLQKLKDVAYDAEDVIDEYQAKSAKDDHKRMLVRGKRVCTDPFTLLISCFRKHLVHRYQLGKKIKAMNDRLGQISKERMRYTLEGMEAAAAEKRRAVGSNRATASLMVEDDIVGRDSDRDDLVKKLLSEDLIMCGKSSSVPIVSIVGIGGLGKTTLARMIFNDRLVEGHFEECRWWICVSQCVDAEDLAKRMLQEVKGSTVGLSGLNTLCTNLNNVLSRKKFLLVFDDVWDLEWWKQLEALLKKAAHGSRILITTRMETISEEISAAYMHKPKIFSFSEGWQLFLRKALKKGETEEDLARWNLKDVGEDIVRKCGGLPIAVETVGSTMRLKRREREAWKYIADSEIWRMSSPSNSSLLPGLVLSYDVLPSVLKRCFAYLRLCPKGYSLAKDDFIKNIMAHRIVEDEDAGADMETIAKGYIDDLLGRCLFEQDKSEVFLSLHDIIYDLAVHVVGKEYNYNSVDKHTRHLVLGRDVDSLNKIELQATKVLRTLMCYGRLTEFPLNKYMSNLKRLRVLDLTGGSFSRLPDSIGDLILLRHLDLMNTNIEELPASIRKLNNLQTLLLDGSQIKRLPKEIGHLWNLRHLGLRDTSNLQFVAQGLGNLTCLRTMNRYIICGTNGTDSGCNIRELKELRKLRGQLVIEHLERVGSIDDAREAMLQEKHHIEDLQLVYGTTSEEEERKIEEVQENISDVLQLPPDLKGLGLNGYCGRRFPAHWLLSENQLRLRNLKLQNCPFLTSVPDFLGLICLHLYKCNCLETFPVMPQLSELEINGINRLKVLPSMPELKKMSLENLEELNQVPCFPKLEFLKVKLLTKWNRWSLDMEGKSMPLLSTLEIGECPMLESIPHFPKLRRLEIRECNNLHSLHDEQLTLLKVEKCHGLKQLPCLRGLEELEMRSLNNWEGWSTGSSMSQLRWLQMFGCPKLKSLPHFSALSYMSIEMCQELCTLWDEEKHPRELETLLVFGCPRASFPVSSLPHLSKLKNLGMGGFLEWPHRSAPLPTGALPELRILGMSGIPGQVPLPNWLWHLSHLEVLHLSGITEGTRLQGSWQNLKKLERLTIQSCPKLATLEDLISPQHLASSSQQSQLTVLSKLQELSICDCPQLKLLPNGLQQLVQLKSLTLEGLPELTSLPQQVTNLHNLEELTLRDCLKISSLPPGLSHRLKAGLVISGCTNLRVKKNGCRFSKPISFFLALSLHHVERNV